MNKYRPDPTPVLNAIVSTDTVVMAYVSQTVFFTDYRDSIPPIADAIVSLFVNGRHIETMQFDSRHSRYMSSYIPSSNDTVKIVAETSIGRAEGTDIVPSIVEISDLKLSGRTYESSDIISNGRLSLMYEMKYSITFTDPADEKNYYCIRIETDRGAGAEHIDYSYEDIFVAQGALGESSTNEGRTFTDELINGKTYTLTLVERSQLYTSDSSVKRNRRVILYSLSENYYKYLTTILNSIDSDLSGSLADWGLAEPAIKFSNIKGGTGIVGAVRSSFIPINITTGIPL
jgi:hypothetical protein